MLLWVAMAIMTAIAVIAVLAPIARARTPASEADDVAVYRDQLAEIDRDAARGLLPGEDAKAARAEVARRLLAAAERARQAAPAAKSGSRRAAVGLAVVIGLPVVAVGGYLALGSPGMPAQPLEARLSAPPDRADIAQLIARAEAQLARDPENGQGWQLMGPIYMRLGRYSEAATAFANAIRLLGSTADREAMRGVALVAEAGGVVTADARAAFDRALAIDPKHAQARISRAVGLEQDGDTAGALAELKGALADAPAGAPWVPGLKGEIARLEGKPAAEPAPAPGPGREDVAAAQAMAPEQRTQMIRGMVAGLAERLSAQGGAVDEWLRLVRSYAVLGETEKAREAAAKARAAYGGDAAAQGRIDDLVASLGLGG